jgi:hypothetical protein
MGRATAIAEKFFCSPQPGINEADDAGLIQGGHERQRAASNLYLQPVHVEWKMLGISSLALEGALEIILFR